MKYLPFEKYTLHTNLSIAEARQRLLDNLEPARNGSNSMKNKTRPFTGAVNADGFNIQRVIQYRNSFLPTISGRFSNDFGNTDIEIKMRLSGFTLIFMIVWLGVTGSVCVGLLLSVFLDLLHPTHSIASSLPNSHAAHGTEPAAFLVFLTPLFGYALLMVPFTYEASRAKQLLAGIFPPLPSIGN